MNTLIMKPSALFDMTIRHTPWRPRHLHWVMQDMAGVARQPEQDHRTHLRATLEWVCRAQDACRSSVDSGCVAAGFSFGSGWLPASADTTGRLIETLLPAAEYLAWPVLADRARAMLDALLAQADAGSAGRIHGLIAGHVQLGHGESLARAVCSARALAGMSMATAAQHAQAAHALASVGVLAGESNLLDAARRHLEIVLAQQTPCGWFPDSAGPASSAGLADILRSLIETARLLDDPRARQAALRAGHGLRGQLREDGRLAGAFDDGWMPAAPYVGVTGLAQLAVCWLRLAQRTQDAGWRDPAWRALAWIKRSQRTAGDDLALRDALPSAVPIWGGPAAFSFDTLSAKHFADALMMDMVGIVIPPESPEMNA
ncbi:MAG: hypothetical protein ACYCZS_12325 [Thiobacillus sp.]